MTARGRTGDGYGVACPPVVGALSTGWGASVVSVAVAVGATGAKVDSVAAGAAGLVANPVGDAPVTAPDVAVLVGSGAWLVEPRPDAGAGPGAGAGDPWKACRIVVPLVLASETGCPMSASATVIAPSARTAATTTAAASAAHLRPRRCPAGRRELRQLRFRLPCRLGLGALHDVGAHRGQPGHRLQTDDAQLECARRSECA